MFALSEHILYRAKGTAESTQKGKGGDKIGHNRHLGLIPGAVESS